MGTNAGGLAGVQHQASEWMPLDGVDKCRRRKRRGRKSKQGKAVAEDANNEERVVCKVARS